MSIRTLLLLALGLFAIPTVAVADDWPQWMGPKRDNVWREDGILDSATSRNGKRRDSDRDQEQRRHTFCGGGFDWRL